MADWESLSEQLKALGVNLGKEQTFKKTDRKSTRIEEVVDGRFIEVIYGQTFVHDEYYTKSYIHGTKPLYPACPIEAMCRWANAEGLSLADLDNFIFLDTETSGLAGGTGTYAFEVGVGRFTPEGFKLAQFFMRHPGEEAALLAGLTQFMDGMKAVVTYNGKSFDIPLLNTRYTLMGMSSPFEEVEHFDLLALARRLWRIRLESRTLGNVENEILGFQRSEEEVPGYLIPEMYFEYLRSRDARPMAGIFYHNAMDILSLASLFSHTAFLLHNPFSEAIQHGEDIVALARFYEAMDDIRLAGQLYEKAIASALPEALLWDTVERYSFFLKRQGAWKAAMKLWERAAAQDQLYAFEELAKYYEHQAKILESARHWTLSALAALERTYLPAYEYRRWQQDLSHRLNRLERRLGLQDDAQ
jgi:hypothetical protein